MKLRKWIRRKLSGVVVEQLTFGWGNEKQKKLIGHSDNFKYKKVSDLKRTSSGALFIITINLSEYHINWLNDMVRRKHYSSRSHAVRLAVEQFIYNSDDFINYLEKKYGELVKVKDKEYKVIGEA